MQLKTSTKISLKFTFFASVILFIFSFVIFVLFFRTRYSKQKARLYVNAEYEPPFLLEFVQRAPGGSIAYQNVPLSASDAAPGSVPPIRVSFTQVATPANRKHFLDHKLQKIFGSQRRIVSDAQEILLEDFSLENGYYPREGLSRFSRGAISIFFKDGEYFVYTIEHNIVKFLNITGFVYSQLELIQILLFWDCCFLIVVYVISLYFVKSSLKNLKKMARFAQELDFNTLSSFLDIKGHKYDEIKVIADAFNASLQKINVQIISLKDFIANASHELKTPLMMINSEIDIALKKKDYEERLLNIKQSVKRLSDLLEHLSLITRLESAPVIQKESLLLESFVDEVVAPLSKKYPTVHISLQIPHGYTLLAHPVLLEVVIRNLLENACKYAGKKAQISFIADEKGFAVKDTGIGIAAEYQEKIFERFWQLENVEQEGYSFGLGLYLVKKIVELHGWSISIESELGKGSTFSIVYI